MYFLARVRKSSSLARFTWHFWVRTYVYAYNASKKVTKPNITVVCLGLECGDVFHLAMNFFNFQSMHFVELFATRLIIHLVSQVSSAGDC